MSQSSGSTPTSGTGGAAAPVRLKRRYRDGFRKLGDALGHAAGAFGPLKAVIDEIVEIIEKYESTTEESREYEKLHEDLESLLENLSEYSSESVHLTMTRSMEGLCNVIKEELHHLKQKDPTSRIGSGVGLRRRYKEGELMDVSLCYQRIHGHLQRLVLNVNMTRWKINDEQAADTKLERLKKLSREAVMPEYYNSAQSTELKRGPCSGGTRLDVLDRMNRWIYASPDGAVYWLSGMAGTGKTTIAYSLCDGLDLACNLAANFFCSRLLPECRAVSRIIPSIAYQLARFSRPFRCALLLVLEKDPEVHTRTLQIQFDALMVQPLMKIRDTLPTNLIVVIDGLDECEDQGSAGQILNLLLNSSPGGFPIKFFVSSRPEPHIRDQIMVEAQVRASARLVLHELDQSIVRADIETYLRTALEPMKPSELQISELGKRAGILFIYASTVVRYIGFDNFRRNPHSRLEAVLGISSSHEPRTRQHNEIDALYMSILESAFEDPNLDEIDKEDMKQVLYTVTCAREPLTMGALAVFLKFHDVGRVQAALRPLWSVLYVVEASELVTTLHTSFPDFLSDVDRSHKYWCDTAIHEGFLAGVCFDYIQSFTPRFNICKLESSHVADNQVVDFDRRVSQSVPIQLFYACRYWGTHLRATHRSFDPINKLDEFLSTKLLLWMEVLNLKKSIMIGINTLRFVHQLGILNEYPRELLDLIEDALQFVATFAISSVAQSTPHLYVSMLQFWPRSLPVAKRYEKYMRRTKYTDGDVMGQLDTALSTWTVDGAVVAMALAPDGVSAALAIGNEVRIINTLTGRVYSLPSQGHTDVVKSIMFSPDGSQIVSGSADATVGLWDFQQGGSTVRLLKEHTGPVACAIFSPQGDQIFSGSYDGTICIWDAQTGQAVCRPFEGHRHPITSLSHSSSGSSLISGSYDCTIRLWDTRTRQLRLTLQGHEDSVTSVMFSPDDTRIISGSWDKTVRIWDVQSGQAIFGPLEGHASWVLSVAFSPDGAYAVSGSLDQTIRLWDSQTGMPLRNPLHGHTRHVTTVGFFPGGTRIYSASWDLTVRVWHIQRDKTEFIGHTGPILSVAFSPDGKHIVSGSEDSTVCIWEALSGKLVHMPLKIHSKSVKSVKFSPNGTQVISGSLDGTVCVINTLAGDIALRLNGHLGPVNSVDFSPDNTRIISGSDDCAVIIWDASTGSMLLKIGGQSRITSVCFSSDGAFIASSSRYGVMVRDAQTGISVRETTRRTKKHDSAHPLDAGAQEHRSVTRIGEDKMEGILYTHEGRNAKPGGDYSAANVPQRLVHRLAASSSSAPYICDTSVRASPHGNMFVSASQDGEMHVWKMESDGKKSFETNLNTRRGPVTSVCFSPDGPQIAFSTNGWDLSTSILISDIQGEPSVRSIPEFKGHVGTITSINFSPNGTRLVSGSVDKTIRVWDTQSLRSKHYPPSYENVLEWRLLEDGWVIDNQSRLLFWAPPRLREHLVNRTTLLIAADYSFSIAFDERRTGESWTECFQPD